MRAPNVTICILAALVACAPERGGPGPRLDPPRAHTDAAELPTTGEPDRSVPASDGDAGAEPAVPPPRDGPRLTSIASKTWIRAEPRKSEGFLGYVRVGQSVRLKSLETLPGPGCPGGFYAIEPHGYVCNDRTVTLERESPWIRANAETLPEPGPFPYQYAISNGAPMYARLPTEREQEKTEWRYGKAGAFTPLPMFQRGHEHLAVTDPIVPTHPIPAFLREGRTARGDRTPLVRRTIPHGAMLAYTRAFDHGGRTFLLSTDLTVVPADRVRRFRPSRFRGTELSPGKVELPLAWFRAEPRPVYIERDGAVVPNGERWPVRSFVALTGAERSHQGRRYLEVRGEPRRFAAADDATVVERRDERPFGVGEGDKWILVDITDGTLVAYEDLEPVYATLISPGLGGVPRKGGDLVKDSTTPLGAYRITFKDRAATMSPEFGEDRSFWIADVPFTQYFRPPFALHAAYWHERFGELMSGGCINASPIDAAWLFAWTEPAVPEGWQGATGAGAKQNGRASWIVVKR